MSGSSGEPDAPQPGQDRLRRRLLRYGSWILITLAITRVALAFTADSDTQAAIVLVMFLIVGPFLLFGERARRRAEESARRSDDQLPFLPVLAVLALVLAVAVPWWIDEVFTPEESPFGHEDILRAHSWGTQPAGPFAAHLAGPTRADLNVTWLGPRLAGQFTERLTPPADELFGVTDAGGPSAGDMRSWRVSGEGTGVIEAPGGLNGVLQWRLELRRAGSVGGADALHADWLEVLASAQGDSVPIQSPELSGHLIESADPSEMIAVLVGMRGDVVVAVLVGFGEEFDQASVLAEAAAGALQALDLAEQAR